MSRSAVGRLVQRPWPGKEPGTEKEQTGGQRAWSCWRKGEDKSRGGRKQEAW